MSLHDNLYSVAQSIVICVLPIVLMAGCIIIPIPTGEKPYYTGTIPGLEVGVTSKAEAISRLGNPNGSYSQGSELVYIDTTENWKIAFALIMPGGGGGVETLHKRHVLLLSFDEDEVLNGFELETAGDDFGDCTRNGFCFGESSPLMRYASEASEKRAKEFRAVEGQCSVYLHGPGNKKAIEVSLGGKVPVNVFSTGAFIHWVTAPGRQSIDIHPEPAFLDFECQAGEVLFVHFDYRRIGPSELLLEDQETGRQHISGRRLVMLPTDSVGLPLPPPVFQGDHDE